MENKKDELELNNTSDELEYTESAWESLYNTVDSEDYRTRDAEMIFRTLEECMKRLSFGDYLKRYIYRKCEMTENFADVPVSEYQQIIKDSFAETHTAKSFEETSAKLGALSKNWLTQQTVKRQIIFLLGFGLSMSVDDVNMFLTKAIQEPGINPKDPFEVICWYCYKNGYNFLKYEKLWEKYCSIGLSGQSLEDIYGDYTMGLRSSMHLIHDDAALMTYLMKLKGAENKSHISMTAKSQFLALYEEAKEYIVAYFNMTADEDKMVSIDDISPTDFEEILYASVPRDHNGNLTPAKKSKLNELFLGRRLSRQRIHKLLTDQEEINRFDILTLNFLIYSQKNEYDGKVQNRYSKFLESSNTILEKCFMGKIYIQNPYECFLLMCILSEDPLGTYADVWEMSF